jgi:hypothetical protein
MGAWGGVVVKALRYYSGGPVIDSRLCHWIFQWHISFRPYHGPGVNSASSENEYQECLLGVKVTGAWGWQPLQFRVRNVMEIWEPKHSLTSTPGLLRDSFYLISTITECSGNKCREKHLVQAGIKIGPRETEVMISRCATTAMTGVDICWFAMTLCVAR